MTLTRGLMSRLTESRRRLIEPEDAYRAPPPDRVSNVDVVRYCAYRQWLPELARRCECWGCWAKRHACAQSANEVRRRASVATQEARPRPRATTLTVTEIP